MSDIVIRAESLGKKYLIGHRAEPERYTALRDVLARGARGLARSAADMLRGRPLVAGDTVEEFWALKDVSFEVKRGEVVGIIGRNGAGKSTLLKILSRITEPSAGRATIKGRAASLLEVGTGFHPELTGRENIYLNGAILGMTRAEIRAKFDEIVAFAEVEKFLDTPVKRYSSGMYVRLAFAVAAHLESEILIVDEVLAVGDAEFQSKCLGKMGEVASGGRTVLFVSHNMGVVRSLCRSGFLLNAGQASAVQPIDQAIARYLNLANGEESRVFWKRSDAPGCDNVRLLSFAVEQPGATGSFRSGEPIQVSMEIDIAGTVPSDLCVGFELLTSERYPLLLSQQNDGDESKWPELRLGRNRLCCLIPTGYLNSGRYYLSPRISIHRTKWIVNNDAVVGMDVVLSHGQSPYWMHLAPASKRPGLVAPILEWLAENAEPEPVSARGPSRHR